jgi:diguanylate cyclase (GGDEF)-like protein/PAS domain S-box-containing protein
MFGFLYIFIQFGLIYIFGELYIKDKKSQISNRLNLDAQKLKLELSELRFSGIGNLQLKKGISPISFEGNYLDGFDSNGYSYISKLMNGEKYIGYGTFSISQENLKQRFEKIFSNANISFLFNNEVKKYNCGDITHNAVCGNLQILALHQLKEDQKDKIFLAIEYFDQIKGSKLIILTLILSSIMALSFVVLYLFRKYEIKKSLKLNLEYESLFNSNTELIFFTTGEKFIRGNRALHNFFSVVNDKNFIERYKNICNHFKITEDHIYREAEQKAWLRKILQSGGERQYRAIIERNGRDHIFLISAFEIDEYESIVTLKDISDIVQHEFELKKATENRLRNIELNMKFIDEHMIISSIDKNGTIDYVSKALLKRTGFKYENLIGKKYSVMRSPNNDPKIYTEMWENLNKGHEWIGEIQNRDALGNDYWISIHIYPKYDENHKIIGYIAVRLDISDKKLLENFKAIDQLTFLKSSNEFQSFYTREFAIAIQDKKPFSLLLLDIDSLLLYNVMQGVKKGDTLIRSISVIFRNRSNVDKERLFRFFGSGFAMVYPFENETEAKKIGQEICDTVYKSNFEFQGNGRLDRITVSISIFYSSKLSEEFNHDEVFIQTYSKLYQIQKSGGNQCELISDYINQCELL